ncbi:methyltransferase domain-containing protein [Chryseolinea sp. T2]|uniref:methyltransferase domain-containing protein n=1 Tax=Chryseolinea sp. T2 TaxID=3129255 RepID=UPI0030789E11
MYLEQFILNKSQKILRIMDFAPNTVFANNMKARNKVSYTSADFNRLDYDIKVDITNMPEVKSDSYDVLICSHILEHVTSPSLALREIYRVLKNGGIAIIMVPLFWDVQETVEDLSTTSDEQRLRLFGQDDHVRLFSKKDFLQLISSAGFAVHTYTPDNFSPNLISENAISDNSILYACVKESIY